MNQRTALNNSGDNWSVGLFILNCKGINRQFKNRFYNSFDLCVSFLSVNHWGIVCLGTSLPILGLNDPEHLCCDRYEGSLIKDFVSFKFTIFVEFELWVSVYNERSWSVELHWKILYEFDMVVNLASLQWFGESLATFLLLKYKYTCWD